jgi:hypothetical protein
VGNRLNVFAGKNLLKKVVIGPNNPFDVKSEDVQKLAEEIRVSYPNYDVIVPGSQSSGFLGFESVFIDLTSPVLVV